MRGAARGGAARSLHVACVLLALLAAACSERGSRTEDERPPVAQGELDLLATRVDSLFLAAVASPSGDSARAMAFATAEELVREVARSRPGSGWDPEGFSQELRRYRLAAEVREIEGGAPWLLLLRDARRADSPPSAWLLYEEKAALVALPPEPFAQESKVRAWKEEGDGRFAVLGWERGRAGLHPKAWLFRLPSEASLPKWEERGLRALAEQPLCEGSAQRVEWLPPGRGRAPRARVVGAARANRIFEECASCPHLEADLVYGVALEQFVLQEETPRRSPYAAFVGFLDGLQRGDTTAVRSRVDDPAVVETALAYRFDRRPLRGRWRAAPGTSATSLEQVYFRGEEGAFRVLLSVRDSSFVVSSITPTEFVID